MADESSHCFDGNNCRWHVGGSGVELPEGWTVGYDADADIVVNVHVGGLFYAPEALIGGDLND